MDYTLHPLRGRRVGVLLSFVGLGIFQILLAIYSQYPTTITPDAAMHAEIVEIVKQQGFIRTWEPYASNEFTYPPLFHYLAALLSLDAIDAVRLLGIISWLLFPYSIFILVSTYDWRAALPSAFFVGLVPSFSTIFIYGEFPQLLAMLFLVVEWYFLRRERYVWGAIFAGLVVLTHSFIPFVAIPLLLYYLGHTRCRYIIITGMVSLPWWHAYGAIVHNALSGAWENTRYNAVQPVFGFWPLQTILDWIFGSHGLTPFLVPLALIGFFRVKDVWLRLFFVFGLFFTVFHVPFTQLKVYDLLVLPVVILAGVGLVALRIEKKYLLGVAGFLFILLGVLQVQHFENAWVNWFNPEIAPTAELTDAAQWLGRYDSRSVRIYSHHASAWVGVLSGKLPLDPDITHLEAFSEDYTKQLMVQREIKDRLLRRHPADVRGIALQNRVEYLVVPREFAMGLRPLYTTERWGVYSVGDS